MEVLLADQKRTLETKNKEKSDRFLLRKDVMILRQVVYKELMEIKRNLISRASLDTLEKAPEGFAKNILSLTPEDRQWIDSQVQYFFTEMPPEVLAEFNNEFPPKEDKLSKPVTNPKAGQAKVDEKDLESETGIY